jgi:hypothetical protein
MKGEKKWPLDAGLCVVHGESVSCRDSEQFRPTVFLLWLNGVTCVTHASFDY